MQFEKVGWNVKLTNTILFLQPAGWALSLNTSYNCLSSSLGSSFVIISNVSICCVDRLVSFGPHNHLEVTNRQTLAFASRARVVQLYLLP